MNKIIIDDFIKYIQKYYDMSEIDFAYAYNEQTQADTTKTNIIVDNYITSKYYDYKKYNDGDTFTFEDFGINVNSIICDYFLDALPF